MVRETRHLWVGNLPENISEERIREHFKRYGPVQSVKVVSGNCEDGVSATVAFVDICSAAKAHKADHRMEERLLKTTYYEPSLTALSTSNTHYPSQGSSLHRENSHYSSAAPQSNSHVPHGARSPRFSAGLNEDLNSYERSSHFYESRRDETIGYNGPGGGPGLSGVSVGAGVQGGLRRGGYLGDRESEFGAGSRGRVRSYPPRGHFLTNGRAEPGEYRWAGGSAQYRYHADTYVDDKLRRGTQGVSPPPPPIPRPAARNPRLTIPSNKRRLPTSRSGSESPSSSRSSRSSSSSSSTSSSRSSSSRSGSLGRSSRSNSRSPRRIGNAAQSVSNTLPVLSPPGEKRPLAISVKNLPPWSSDNSLKDGLFHDYKKHGKVTTVRIFGTGSDRYAVVCFKKPEDAEKAFDASQDKQFFGVKIQVSPHEGLELDDAELRNYDAELDEYHPKATRTLFIGGLDKDVTPAELRKQFESFGEIIEIDIKKQNSSTFAFCQFSDIRSVVQAVKKMDGEHFGGNRIKLGFGKSMPNRCIWDRHATTGVNEMRGCIVGGKRLQIDFASRECQAAFYENLNKPEFPATGTADRTWERRGEVEKFDRTRREGSYIARQLPNQRIQNYTATRTRTRYEGFEEYNAGNFDEFADNSFERDLHEYAGRQRFENGPSTSAHTTTTASTTTSTTKHRNSFSPTRKLDDKSPISPRSIAWDSENLSPVIRAHDEMERKAGRHRSTSDHDSFHSQSPPPRGRNSTGGSRMPSQSPSTPLATSPSREVTVVDDPRRRRPSEFKDLVVRVSDMRRPSNSPVRHRSSSNHRGHSDMDVDEGDSFTSRSELLETRTSMRREEPFSSGDERSLDGADRPCKKQKYGENVCGVFDKPVKRNAESFDYRARDPSPGFRKPFESRKPVEGKFSKRENNAARDDTDQRHRKASISGCSDVEENSWRARDLVIPSTTSDGEFLSDPSPPGTPVRDEPEDPPVESSRRSVHSIPIQREKNISPLSKEKNVSPLSRDKNTSPLSLPLPKFAHQVRLHLSPRGNCASPRGGSILRSPTFNTGTNWSLQPPEVNNTVDESDSVLADTPVSPGPALHDSISDSEESPSVSPTNVAGDLYERIKALDEKFDKWSGSRSTPASTASCRSSTTSPDKAGMKNALNSVSFLRKKRILDLEELKSQEPSPIMKSLLSKRSVFDEDSERLENISDKYEPRPFSSVPRTKVYPTLTSSSSYSIANNSNATSNFTSTTLPIPSATPLNSLPGIRRLSTSTSLPMSTSQATRMPLTPTSTVVSVHNISTASLSSTRNSLSKGTIESTLLASASTSLMVTATSSSSTVSSTATAATVLSTCTSVTSSQSQIHFRRSSTGSVSTPGPPQNEIKAEAIASSSSSSPPEKVCDTIVTVTPDTRVTGAVSVVQTSCSYNTTTTTTQAITCSSSSVQQPSPLLDSSLKGKHLTDEKIKVKDHSEERSAPLNIVCDKKVLTEKEQVQNSSEPTVKDSTYSESNKFKVKDHYNSSSSNNNSNNSRKSESTTTVKIKKEPPDGPEVCRYSEPANIHKRRLSSTEADSSERRSSKSAKEFMKSDSKSLEPDNKKIKMEQEEEKENKSIKVYREKEVQRSERKERNKSVRKEEVKENFEEKSIVQTLITGSVLTDVFDVKNESKHKKEDRLELREKLESHKINDFKEEKMREGEREKKREKLEEKEKNQHFHKHVHSEKHRSIDKSTDRKLDRVEEKKDVKLECKDEKLEDFDEKRRDVKDESKLERKEEREEKVKDYDKRRHSEESKSREERKERSRDRKDKDRIRDKERHRTSFSHADKDNERDKGRDRDKIRSKDKEKRHSKSSKSEERIKHQSEKHGEKKERRDTLSSLSSPSDHSSVSSIYCEKMAKHYPHKPIKPASQISVEHEEESDIGISSSCGHNKSYRSSQSKDLLSDKGDEYGYQERINKESVDRKKHDSGKSEDKSKSHSSRKSSSSHYSKSSKSSIIDDDEERKLRIESDEISSDDDKMKVQLQPAKRTKQRATSSSSGSRRGRPKNKSILDTESESADSESDSEHKPKKPSYFDITIYDGNMYDKVKARREKSAQKPDDELKQKLKPKLLQQRSKRSKKALSSSCEAIQTESDDSDTEVLKKRGHARIHSSSEEESYIRSRTNQLSSEESDSTLPPIKYEKKKSISNDSNSKKCSQKILHVSDITTDEETVTNQSIDRHSGTDSEAEHQQSEQVLKIESESEMSEPGSRNPPRPALSASRNRPKEKEKLCRLSDKSSYLHKENRAEEEADMVVISEEVRHMKPKLRAEPLEVINNKVTVCEKRKYSDSSIKEKGRKEGRMKAIFGLMSDDSDSNASPTTLPLTSPELISATSYRKGSVSSGASSEPLHLTPPNQPRSQSGIYESDIDDDFRPATPDLPSQKRVSSDYENSVIEKNNVHHCELKSLDGMKDILQESEVSKEEILNPCWRDVREQAVKETVCETSRAASDSGKGSSSGVSSASSSSGSSAEELLLLEARELSSSTFREEPEINIEIEKSNKFIFEREKELKESVPRKDKKKKKKHKDKESSRSHRHSCSKENRESHSHSVEKKSTRVIEEQPAPHHLKFTANEEPATLNSHKKDRSVRNSVSSNSSNNENVNIPTLEELHKVSTDLSTDIIPEVNNSPPLDMPLIKPDDLEPEPDQESNSDVRESEGKLCDLSVDSESAVQSIASGNNNAPASTHAVYEITDGPCSPPAECTIEELPTKSSRSTISKEETLNAVASLLACYNDYREETSPPQTDDEPTAPIEVPIEQSEEAQKAAQLLQSEIGGGAERETEERDESWDESTVENVEESSGVMSPDHSETNNSSLSLSKKVSEEIHSSPKCQDVTIKEPLHFPDSPSSVQSEPALQIDEDEQLESLDTNISEEKVSVIKELATLPQERSSVWNTPESDIQEGKALGVMEDVTVQNRDKMEINVEETIPNTKTTVIAVTSEAYSSVTENTLNSENEKCKTEDLFEKEVVPEKLPTVIKLNEEPVECKSISEPPKNENVSVFPIQQPVSSSSIENKDFICNNSQTEISDTKPSDISKLEYEVKATISTPDRVQDVKSDTVEDIMPVNEKVMPQEPVVKDEATKPAEIIDELSIKTETKVEKECADIVNHEPEVLDLQNKIDVEKDESFMSDASHQLDTPNKSSEDMNRSFDSSFTEPFSTPEKDFRLDDQHEGRSLSVRGRARGRGRRGCRRLVDVTSTPTGPSTILTRSSVSTRICKSRGRGRNARKPDTGDDDSVDTALPEQPRRSTRMKRARKHPDMVEHDETTNRRKRGGRSGKISGEEAALRASLSSSDVYDFHDSDDDELEMAIGNKKGKKDPSKPSTPRSPAKVSEETVDLQDGSLTRKSRRLRDKGHDGEMIPTSEGELEGETPPPPTTRSRGRGKKDIDDDDICNTPRKSPRNRSKISESEQDLPGREIIGVNDPPVGEVVIQKLESPINNAMPSVVVPPKTLIIPCSTPKIYSNTIPPVSSTSQLPNISVGAVPAIYSSTVNSHPVKLSIVQAGVRNISKGTPVTCVMTSQAYTAISNQNNPSALTVTSMPVVPQLSRENFVSQTIPFTVASPKDIPASPIKTVVSINCNSLPPSAFKAFPNGKKPDTIPTPLVDPVTGHLTPMKISDEGHYIPIAEHLQLAAKDKLGQPLHQTKVLRAVLPSSITVTTISNSSPSVSVSIPNTVSTLVSSNRQVGICALPKGVNVTSLPRGSEVSVELVSRTRPTIPPTTTANIILSSSNSKGIPNFNTKSQISLTTSHGAPTPPLTNTVISSHVSMTQANTSNVVTIATPNKIFTTASSTLMTTTTTSMTRGSVLGGTLAQIKGPIPSKIQPVPVAKVTGNVPTGLNVQGIILTPSAPLHPNHRPEYSSQVIASNAIPQQPSSSSAGSIGTVSVSRIPPARVAAGTSHEQLIPEYVALGVSSRYQEQSARFREPPIVEVGRLPVGSPVAALSPVARGLESDPPPHLSNRQHYDLHPVTPNALGRQGIRNSPAGPMPHVQAAIGTKGSLSQFYDLHKKGGATSQSHPGVPPGVAVERHPGVPPGVAVERHPGVPPGVAIERHPGVPPGVAVERHPGVPPGVAVERHPGVPPGVAVERHPGVPPGVAVERFLASPPLHTPPSTQTPPPAHHNTPVHRENLQINPIYHRGPYLVSDPRGVYGEKIANLSPMPMDLKVIEKGHLVEKSIQDDKDRPGSGPIPLSEFVSRPPTVITPHNPSSPHHLPSPHYDRSTDSPQVTMMYNRRYPHYDTNLYPNRAGTPGMEHDTLPRSPMSFSTLPPSDTHHSPRVQIPGPPQYASQVSPQMPTQTENLQYLLQGYPIMWDGILGLKNEQALVKMHFISGSVEVARGALPEGSTSHIRISQRMRLEQSQLEGVARKMQMKAEHCILMALPYGTNPYDLIKQQMSLETGFIKYLGEDKKAAGIVNVHLPGSQQSAFVIHIFPPCDFANENLARIAPELLHGVANTSRLLVIIATC